MGIFDKFFNNEKGDNMGKKKRSKKVVEEQPTVEAPIEKSIEPEVEESKELNTVESLEADGYVFLKAKGDKLVYAKNGNRVLIDKV